jgi:hypothetical protein
MPDSWKGGIAGAVGALVLAGLFRFFHASGLLEQLDIITLIDRVSSIGRASAWTDHFIVGALLWGPLFAGFHATTAERPIWQKGLLFSVLAWLAMMLVFMPVIGAGLFGWRLGLTVPVGMLVLHLIFGAVLGLTFSFMSRFSPAPQPVGPA